MPFYKILKTNGPVATVVTIKNGEEAVERICCANCLDVNSPQRGVFVNGYCSNCGTKADGKDITVAEMLVLDEQAIAEGKPSPIEASFAKVSSNTPTTGKDGLPRKVYFRDVVFPELGLEMGKHYKTLVYREILEDEEKPQGFDPEKKYKSLILVGFENAPVTIEEIQKEVGECILVKKG